MEKLNTKVQRFLELSKEFTVDSNKVYDGFQQQFTSISMSGYYETCCDNRTEQEKPPTKLEQFEIAQKEKIEKAKRFEEYLHLQTELSNYYTALNKIEN